MNPLHQDSRKIKILVVSESELWTASVLSLLANLPDAELLSTARGSLSAYQLVLEMQPHMLIMDDSLPLEEGLSMVSRIKQEEIPLYCIVAVPTSLQKGMAIRAGVDAVINQSSSSRELESALQTGWNYFRRES